VDFVGSSGEWILFTVGTVAVALTIGLFVMIYRLHGKTPADTTPDGGLTAGAVANQGMRRLQLIFWPSVVVMLALVFGVIPALGGPRLLQFLVLLVTFVSLGVVAGLLGYRANKAGRAKPGGGP
jgi:hypothetical protein